VGVPHHFQAGGVGQQGQLAERVLGAPNAAPAGQLGADQEGALDRGFRLVQALAVGGGRNGVLCQVRLLPMQKTRSDDRSGRVMQLVCLAYE
jgi:hypothetical protein